MEVLNAAEGRRDVDEGVVRQLGRRPTPGDLVDDDDSDEDFERSRHEKQRRRERRELRERRERY